MRRNLIAAVMALAALCVAATDDYASQAWKDEIAKGYLPYRKLVFSDFPAFDNTTSRHEMFTQGFVHYGFNARWNETGRGATAKVSNLTVRSGFDRNKSWRRSFAKNDPLLIEHEQGHLDINELHADEMRQIKEMPVGKGIDYQEAMESLRRQMREIAERIIKEAQDEQNRYDQETNHGQNFVKQKLWTEALRERCQQARIKFWDER
jgi:hypothetical protein